MGPVNTIDRIGAKEVSTTVPAVVFRNGRQRLLGSKDTTAACLAAIAFCISDKKGSLVKLTDLVNKGDEAVWPLMPISDKCLTCQYR